MRGLSIWSIVSVTKGLGVNWHRLSGFEPEADYNSCVKVRKS
jgi:hypothetical protein